MQLVVSKNLLPEKINIGNNVHYFSKKIPACDKKPDRIDANRVCQSSDFLNYLAFLDFQRSFAGTFAQVEEFCPSCLAVFHNGDTFDIG